MTRRLPLEMLRAMCRPCKFAGSEEQDLWNWCSVSRTDGVTWICLGPTGQRVKFALECELLGVRPYATRKKHMSALACAAETGNMEARIGSLRRRN